MQQLVVSITLPNFGEAGWFLLISHENKGVELFLRICTAWIDSLWRINYDGCSFYFEVTVIFTNSYNLILRGI